MTEGDAVDGIRTPEWYMSGMEFLVKINPKRYRLEGLGFRNLEFMCIKLIDKQNGEYLGPELFGSIATGKLYAFKE